MRFVPDDASDCELAGQIECYDVIHYHVDVEMDVLNLIFEFHHQYLLFGMYGHQICPYC